MHVFSSSINIRISIALFIRNMCRPADCVPSSPSVKKLGNEKDSTSSTSHDRREHAAAPSKTPSAKHTSKGSSGSGPPLTALSLLWLILCTLLVTRRNELIAVFFSFVTSFVLSALLSIGRPSTTIGKTTKSLTQAQRVSNGTTKNLVALLNCVASLLCLSSPAILTSFTTTISFVSSTSAEFTALSILTGYLAFDLWYSTLCHPPPSKRIASVWEDAITLTTFLIVLAKDEGEHVTSFREYMVLWVWYKVVRVVLDLSRREAVSPTTSGNKLESNSLEADATVSKAPSSPSTAQVAKEHIWTVHDRQYDLRSFVDRHPGGKEAIELGRGRDCTAMFESYHPFTSQHRVVLEKYRVVEMDDTKKEKRLDETDDDDLDPFYEILKERAAQALREGGLDPNLDRAATFGRASYYIFILGCLVTAASYHVRGSILGSFLFAVFGWLIGALGHDGGHFAVSRRPFVNDVSVWGISLLCNPMMWQHQHTYAHHSHTNDFDQDPDLHHFEVLLRVHRRFQHDKIYGLQRNRFFVFFAYAFVVFGTCIKIPLGMIKTGTLYGMVEWTDRKRPFRAFMMLAHYALYIGIILLAPFISGRPWYVAFLCGVTHIVTAGLLFAIFSQINHLNEHSIETESSCDLVKTSWAASQVVTSNNFATRSFAWHVISNGLNLQIEHHLFPGLNHAHLHLIAPTVRQTCEEYGVPYASYESWSELMGATLRWLDTLSVDENTKEEMKTKAE